MRSSITDAKTVKPTDAFVNWKLKLLKFRRGEASAPSPSDPLTAQGETLRDFPETLKPTS